MFFLRFHFPMMHLGSLLILFSCLASLCHGCNQLDHSALLSISHNLSTPPLTPLNWPSNIDCCLWEGIACDLDGHVTHLWLPFRGLRGTLSPSFRNLTRLSHLNLSHNLLSGSLLDGIFSSLSNLLILDLSFNLMSDVFNLFALPLSIQTVDISSNQFTGVIQPSFLELASNLTYFNVSKNSLTGPIPLPTCNAPSLVKFLDFSMNEFSGQIPRVLARYSKLEIFRAGFNSLSGLLPSDIYNITSLKEISLPANKLTGPIDDSLGQLSDLTTLELYDNELTGSLPWDIGKLSNLENMLLHINNLTGTFPSSLLNCTKLVKLILRVNSLEGNLSLLNFSTLQQLRVLDLGNNHFTGNFPSNIYSCKSLEALRLGNNMIGGQISPGIMALQSLSFLSLSYMQLTNISEAIRILSSCKSLRFVILAKSFFNEELPYNFETLTFDGFNGLQVLGLGGCQLTGHVPLWISKLRNIEVVDLSYNQLTDIIPKWLGSMPKLFYVDLSYNLLSGGIPRELAALPSLFLEATEVDLKYIELPLFVQPNNVSHWQYNRLSNLPPAIYLRNNSLSGEIPIEIGQMRFIHILDLGCNNFSGTIPDQISGLTNLEKLDFSNNHLSGEIPPSLGSLYFLSSFNVANNSLQGRVPQGAQLQTFHISSYIGNPKLCGYPLPNDCQANIGNDKHITTEEENDEIDWIYITMAIGYVTGFWVVCGTLFYQTGWRDTYFQFLDDVNDKVYVIIVVYLNKFRRWLEVE